ncbi:hypothetical protein KBB68_03950 [Candidatus Babeliales bacterium]|nr:hypothetical protein [Candidatus Babeliales bacterium]
MISKKFLTFMIIATTINLFCSNEFKQLSVSSESHSRLATKEDIESLKQDLETDRSWEDLLNEPFNHYQQQYHFCQSQKNTGYLVMIGLSIYSVVCTYVGLKNDKQITGITAAIVLAHGALHMQTVAQNYAADQKVLIQKCASAFEISDLESLKQHYAKNSNENLNEFLTLVLTWATKNQSPK